MKVTTLSQFQVLVAEMEKRPAFGQGFRKGIKPINFDAIWNEIGQKLNALGPPVRDGEGWHRVSKRMMAVNMDMVL